MNNLYFTLPELLSLIGITQCIYILTYMVFRSGRLSRAGLPILYFAVLALAFTADFGERFLGQGLSYYDSLQILLWLSGPPLSLLLIVQIIQITKIPHQSYFLLILIPLVTAIIPFSFFEADQQRTGLLALGQILGALSLLSLWFLSAEMRDLYKQKSGKERYWLVLALVIINAGLLITFFGAYGDIISEERLLLIRTVLGLGIVYLSATSLFRIYPAAVRIMPASDSDDSTLSDEELEIALKIEGLFTREKIYQEPGYSRSDLARELNVSEAMLSKIINLHFQKSLPQLLNEYRVEDAKALLQQTNIDINLLAQESGFNSVASFNRVFKEITGHPPSYFRRNSSPS